MRYFDEHKTLIDNMSRSRHWWLSAAYRVAFALLLVSVVGCGDDGDRHPELGAMARARAALYAVLRSIAQRGARAPGTA